MTDFCVIWGPVITILVSLLKKIPFLKNLDPKWLAGALSILSVILPLVIHSQPIVDQILAVLACIIATFGTAVASFEVAKSTGTMLKGDGK